MIIKSARFIISNTDPEKCPAPDKPEYAFIGRSNVGKSSLINMLTGFGNLAKVSSKPGKTQLINHFLINDSWYLVDLPGYGWAKVSQSKKKDWEGMISDYLLKRENLMNIFLLIDIRIPPQQIDLEFMNWLGVNHVPFTIVFTKAEKLSRNKINQQKSVFFKTLSEYWEETPHYIITSAISREGKEEILKFISKINEEFNQ